MFFASRTKPAARPSRRLNGVEQLEDRALLANTNLIMDFTPDAAAGSRAGNFADTFSSVKTSAGYAPRFLDFNRDGWVNNTDVSMAAQQIANKVSSFFSNYRSLNVNVRHGDVLSNSNWGKQWIDYGKYYSSEQVAVMYMGGTNRDSSAIGMAPVASNGYNVEGFGETYTRRIAMNLLNNSNATSTDFVNSVAQTAAHEFGHMLGLRHISNANSYNVMNPIQPRNPGSTYFVDASVNTNNGYQQNAHHELWYSFQGQRSQSGSISSGQRLVSGNYVMDEHGCDLDELDHHDDEHADHGEEHADHGEEHADHGEEHADLAASLVLSLVRPAGDGPSAAVGQLASPISDELIALTLETPLASESTLLLRGEAGRESSAAASRGVKAADLVFEQLDAVDMSSAPLLDAA